MKKRELTEWEIREIKEKKQIKDIREALGDDVDALAEKLKDRQGRREVILEKLKPIQELAEENWQEIRAITEALNEVRVERMNEKGVDWPLLLNMEESRDSSIIYKTCEKELRKLGVMGDGNWQDTKQRAIKLALIKGDEQSLKTYQNALDTLLPHIRVHSDGWLKFSIFEKDLSSNGIWMLQINQESKQAKITVDAWGQHKTQASFPEISQALAYIQQNVWYESLIDEDTHESNHYGDNGYYDGNGYSP